MTIESLKLKYGITKQELDDSGLKFIIAPNPKAMQLEMHLYYEFQVRQKLSEIYEKRELKKQNKKIERQVFKEI